MASAARGESSNSYGGLRIGGKFRKPTARRSQKTPYDRPPTSVRNSGPGGGEDKGGGWLSKLVDPAQRLINYSAHKLFASVFRKRLVSGETPLQSPEQQQLPERDVVQETKVGHTEANSALSMKNDLIRTEHVNASANPTKDGFTDLEKILKEKTFTRSEVDRLTNLLRSKAADSSTINGEQRNDVSIVRHPLSHERDRVHPDNGSMSALVTKPLGSSRALEECIASPAQLAKAYMGSRPSEVTPSMLGLRGQGVREDSVFLNRTPFSSKSPTMSLVPKPSGQRPLENGFVTPRSRGRSAVYSMARTPYSRPQSTVKIGSLFQASPSTWEESLSSGSRQGFQSGLKRRSSVLDNDIGSVGPVRRIRQKSNLSSRSLALPASESPLSVRASGGQNITHTSKDNAENLPRSSFMLTPSQSRETASKIFQEIDKMGSTKEKSPSKLSPSMLRGPALNSLQNVPEARFLETLPEKKANSPGSSYQKQEKSRESGSREVLTLREKTSGAADNTSKTGSSQDHDTRGKGAYMPLTSSLEEHPPKKRAFRMSADEDLMEFDDDHGAASAPFQVVEKQNAFKVEKGVGISMPKGEKSLASSVAMPSTSYIPNGISNGSLETGGSQFSAIPIEAVQQSNMATEPASKLILGAEKSSISPGKLTSEEKVLSLEEPKKAAAVFPNIFSPPVATGLLNHNADASVDIKLEKTNSSTFGVSEALAKPTDSKKIVCNSASGSESTALAASTINGSIFSGGANTVSQPQNNGSLGSTPSFPPSVFGKLPANTSNDSNPSNDSQSTSAPPLSSSSVFKLGEPAAPFSAPSSHVINETEVKNSTSGNVANFKFGGMASADSSTGNVFAAKSSEIKSVPFVFGNASPAVADAGNNILGGSTLNPSAAPSSGPGSSGSLMFGATSFSAPGTEASKLSVSSSPAFASSGSMFGSSSANSVFGFNAGSSASAASSQSQASNLFGAVTENAPTTTTQSMPFQFGSSGPATSFGLSGNTSIASNSFTFGLSKSEPAGFTTIAPAPQLSSTNSSSSSSGTSSSLFGTSWQAPNSAPAPGSSSSTFSFGGGSSAATGSSTFAPMFGASTIAPSSAPVFGFSSTGPTIPQQPAFGSSATPSQSPFGNSTSGFAFGASAQPTNTNGFNNNNQQVSMEDSMAEDTVQANKSSMAQPMFGQPPVSMPQPGFAFGGGVAATPPQPGFVAFGGGGAATPPPQMANPFQFGGQPMGSTPQNAEFQGGGSFSLGSTGGGDKSGRKFIRVKKNNRKK